jgi:asparagine synthase (glutamine-hydrolysing)
MCGICGIVHRPGSEGIESLEGMTDTMVHRGPDDRGYHYTDSRVGLGHRRLSIIDLSPAGRQPMSDESGRIHTLSNGEIYNFEELRTLLKERGHRFAGRCDAEIIPHAYEEWGDAFPEKFRGMFAIALWDEERERLLLVRDRLGIKPLYYHHRGGTFLFASELKGLMAYPGFSRDISRKGLYCYLAFGYVPSPLTIFQDTFKLPPGHILVLDGSGISVKPFWSPFEAAAGPRLPGDENEILDRLEADLKESVKYRLISDVPLGAFLSGGIDSSLTVAAMAELASGPVRTFTIGFWEKEYDEAVWARRVAEHLGTEHTELYVTPEDALAVIPLLPDIYDEPFGDASAIPTYLVSKMTREFVTVALSGDGGDELFCGYPRYRWSYLARPLDLLPRSLRRTLMAPVGLLPHPKARKVASWLGYRDDAEFYLGVVGIWDDGRLREAAGLDQSLEGLDFKRVLEEEAGRPFLERLMLTDLVTYLPEDILTKVDRASMAHSLEVRVPILDHHVVETALRIPLSLKFRRGRGKYLLKRLLGRSLPTGLFQRPKMGFSVPLDHWFRKELKPLLTEYTNGKRLAREGFFDPEPIQRMVAEHQSGERDHQYILWVLLMFQMWLERHAS